MGQTKELLQIIREAEHAENEVRETVKKSKKVRNKGGFLSRFFRSSKDWSDFLAPDTLCVLDFHSLENETVKMSKMTRYFCTCSFRNLFSLQITVLCNVCPLPVERYPLVTPSKTVIWEDRTLSSSEGCQGGLKSAEDALLNCEGERISLLVVTASYC